jgi:hypothetical protein
MVLDAYAARYVTDGCLADALTAQDHVRHGEIDKVPFSGVQHAPNFAVLFEFKRGRASLSKFDVGRHEYGYLAAKDYTQLHVGACFRQLEREYVAILHHLEPVTYILAPNTHQLTGVGVHLFLRCIFSKTGGFLFCGCCLILKINKEYGSGTGTGTATITSARDQLV